MIKINDSIAFHKACKKYKNLQDETDPSIALKPKVRKETKVSPSTMEKQNKGDVDAM